MFKRKRTIRPCHNKKIARMCRLSLLRVNYAQLKRIRSIVYQPTPIDPTADAPLGCFVLLDDAQAGSNICRLYTDLVKELVCTSEHEWESMWAVAEGELHQGHHAVALLQYETGAQLHGLKTLKSQPQRPSRVLIFRACQTFTSEQAKAWLIARTKTQTSGIHSLRSSVDQTEFTEAISKIRAYIAAGDTYQVNYTYRLHFQSFGSIVALYLALRERQPVPYGALIQLQNGEAVLSFSPELFVRHEQGNLTARPMKGTSAATGDVSEDARRAERLSQDSKNRAENLMIVDLLRNDLGRIAQTGSVHVPRLFEVTRFSSVLQMTSTIEAKVRPELSLATVMRALFPCGSITGAPKKRTMEIIDEIETEHRGLYTGAIGWFAPPTQDHTLANFCLSVPIRTLELDAEDSKGERKGRMGVGAGIVYDSEANDEYAECQLKARFLTGLQPSFSLFETMYATREDACRDWPLHLERLGNSAHFFGFQFDPQDLNTRVQEQCQNLEPGLAYRFKLSLYHDGSVDIQTAPLTPLKRRDDYVGFLFEHEVCRLPSLFLAHKSSIREQYDTAWQRAEKHGAFDAIFINRDGKVTEGGRSAVFVRLGSAWYTPPLSDGVLPSIMRQKMLADPALRIQERSISVEELLSAEDVMLANSLRGMMPARRVLL